LEKAISIGIGRQEEEPVAFTLQAFGSFGTFVNGEIIEDGDIARRERRGELGFDPEIEGGSTDRLVDYPRRCQLVAAQTSDEGLGSQMAKGSVGA
jgi:hypothetical protein